MVDRSKSDVVGDTIFQARRIVAEAVDVGIVMEVVVIVGVVAVNVVIIVVVGGGGVPISVKAANDVAIGWVPYKDVLFNDSSGNLNNILNDNQKIYLYRGDRP